VEVQPEPAIDISNWEEAPTPSTSQDQQEQRKEPKETKKRVAKICGQNICLDDSILKRNAEATDSDEEFFNEIDRISDSVDNIEVDLSYRQTVVVTNEKPEGSTSNNQRFVYTTEIAILVFIDKKRKSSSSAY
jgi:hypothetical protein